MTDDEIRSLQREYDALCRDREVREEYIGYLEERLDRHEHPDWKLWLRIGAHIAVRNHQAPKSTWSE
jgi:hypothetical protein